MRRIEMRLRPLHAAFGIVLVSAVGLPAAAASAPAGHAARLDQIPLTVGKAFVKDLHRAVQLEQMIPKEIPKVGPVERDLAKSRAELALVDTGLAKYDDTDAAEAAVRHAEAEDKAAMKEAKKARPNWSQIRLYDTIAITSKKVAITDVIHLDSTQPAPPPRRRSSARSEPASSSRTTATARPRPSR